MATQGTKSSHSGRAARRSSARKRAGSNRSRRSSSRPKAPAAPPAPAHDAGAPARAEAGPEASLANLSKREIEVRHLPIARRFHDCPRCANHHEALEVKSITRSPEGFTHFAICPNLSEPILLTVAGA